MHPIERLRYVARAGPAPVEALVRQAAAGLAAVAHNPSELLLSCRQLVRRRSHCGPLVWLSARMLTGADPRREAREAVTEIRGDPTVDELTHALASHDSVLTSAPGDVSEWALSQHSGMAALVDDPELVDSELAARFEVLLVESDCTTTGRAVLSSPAARVVELASAAGVEVWLVAGTGRCLPEDLFDAAVAAITAAERAHWQVIEVHRHVAQVVTPVGLRTPLQAKTRSPECAAAMELFNPRP